MYLTLKKGGHQKENEGQNTEEKVFKVAVQELRDHHYKDHGPQDKVQGGDALFLLDLLPQ